MAPTVKPPTSIQLDLHTKLIYELRKTTYDSMQVVGFLMWVQTLIDTDVPDLLVREVMKQPNEVVDAVAGEILESLKWVQSQIMPYTFGIYDMPYLRAIMADATKVDITMDHLYRHRQIVIKGVRKMVRAFIGIYGDEDDSTAATAPCCDRRPLPKTPTPDVGKGKAVDKSEELPLCAEVKESAPPPKAEVETAAVKRFVPYTRYRRKWKRDAGAGPCP